MKKFLLIVSMVLMIGLSGCIWCDDCGHHDRRPVHSAGHGGPHGPHHGGGHHGHGGHHR